MNLKVKSALDKGPLFNKNNMDMAGLDGAYSIPLNDGRTLWFFGDTLIGKRKDGQSLWYEFGLGEGEVNMSGWGSFRLMLNNTGILVPQNPGFSDMSNFEFVTDSKKNIRQLIGNLSGEAPDDYRIWCLDGCTIGDTVYLYYVKILMLPDQPLLSNFRVVGAGLARGNRNTLEFTRIGKNDFSLFWKEGEPGFGSAVFHNSRDGWVYLYGSFKKNDGEQVCYLSRTEPGEIENIGAYRYWAGNSLAWSRQLSDAVPVFGGMPNEMSVSWNSYLGQYLSVHSMGLTGKIVARTSDNPWGPWSEPEVIWNVKPMFPATDKFSPLIYAGKEHPEMSPDGGKTIFVTYIEFEEYFPHLVEIELDKK